MNQGVARNQLWIAGVGMITPIGGNTAMTLAAVNAGISRYQVSSFFNRHSKPITTTKVPDDVLLPLKPALGLMHLSGREKRLIQMSAPALSEVFGSYPFEHPLPLFLAGPENLPSGAKEITAEIFTHLVSQSGVNIDIANSRYLAKGRSGVIEAIAAAFKYMAITNAPYVLVGGVDSYLDAATLGYLDAEDRVLAEDTSSAFAPGEGAAFLLLSAETSPNQSIAIFPPGVGIEPGHLYSDSEEPYLGQGLCDAFTAAIQNGSGEKISTIYSSMNGENYFSKELGVAILRNKSAFKEDYKHEHPADCYGDIGAATGAVLIALARHSLIQSKKKTQKLVCCSSDFSSRAAICLTNVDVKKSVTV